MNNNIVINGKIVRQSNRQPIAKLRLETWDRSTMGKEPLASAITNGDGRFCLFLEESYIGELYGDHYPDVFFRVFAGNTLLASTESTLVVNLRGKTNDITVAVDYQGLQEQTPNFYTVTGQILQGNFSPASHIEIALYDKGVVGDTEITRMQTDDRGYFETRFDQEVFLKAGKASPDLFLGIYQPGGNQQIHTSSVKYNASSVTEFQEVIGGAAFPQKSEFEMLDNKLSALLHNTPVNGIRSDENQNPFSFLSKKTGSNEQKIKWMVMAAQITDITKLPAPFWYALLRGQLVSEYSTAASFLAGSNPDQLVSLIGTFQRGDNTGQSFIALSQEPAAILRALSLLPGEAVPNAFDTAIRQGIIPVQLQSQREELLKQWTGMAARYRHQDKNDPGRWISALGPGERDRPLLNDLHATFSNEEDRQVLPAAENNPLGDDATDALKTITAINNLVNDQQTASALKARWHISRPEEVSRLAGLAEEDWQKLAAEDTKTWTPGKIKHLREVLEKSYPTAAFAGKLRNDSKNDFIGKDAILNFLDAFPEMELHHTNLEQFFNKNEKQIDGHFGDTGMLRSELKKMQRVFRLAPDYEATKTLLQQNLASSQHIYNLGRNNFVARVAGTIPAPDAHRIFNKAERSYASALAIAGELKSLELGASLNVLPDVKEAYDAMVMKDFPDLKTLFAGTDNWECKDCRNVYSPAAYTADALKWLSKRGSTTPFQSAKQVLFKRRKDIGEIDLNCNNTNTAIPYIDLVCEILEDILSTTPVLLSAAIEPLLKEGLADPGVVAEFKAKNLGLDEKSTVTLLDASTWFIRDELHTYKIEKTGGLLNTWLLKQTHGTAAERNAIPEFINYTVYDNILKNEKHPFTLPYDLSWDETRAYLDKIGVDRAAWMEAFQNKTVPSPTDLEIAAESLGMAPAEKDLITNPDPLNQNLYWGGMAGIDTVSVFLQKSGIEYTDLLALLRLKFINPGATAKIIHHDTTANLDNKTISNLDKDLLDRMHRFMRLWRKTSWKMADLDMALMSLKLGNGILNGAFLVSLKNFIELKNQLNKTAEEINGYYDNLNAKGSGSLYNSLFQSKIILNPIPDAFKIALVSESPFPDPAPPAPDGSKRTITGQSKSIAAVLKLKEEDVTLIKAKSLPDDHLSLPNLSQVYRVASLINKLKLSATEFYLLLEILNTGAVFDPFADLVATKKFIALVSFIRAAKFNVYELYYLLLQKDGGPRPLIPTEKAIAEFITKGRVALQKIKDDLAGLTGLPDEKAKTLIGKMPGMDEAATNETVQIFNGSFTGTTPARDSFLDTVYGPVMDTAPLKTRLNDRDAAPAADKDIKTLEAYKTFVDLLLAMLSSRLSKQAIYQLHQEQFALAADINQDLLDYGHLQGVTDSFLSYWSDPNLLAKNNAGAYINAISPANFPNLFAGFQCCNKVAMLQLKLPLNVSLFGLLIKHAADFNVTGFDELPVTAGVLDSRLEKWQNYVRLQQFGALYPDSDTGSLASVLQKLLPAADTEANFLKALADYTLWDQGDLLDLRAKLGLVYTGDYVRIETYMRLDQCMNLLALPAFKANQIGLVIKPSPAGADAIAVMQLVKSKYGNDQWLNTSASIQAVIREKKRDALVAYFTHNTINGNNFSDDNEMYGYYLLDTEMGAKEVTTRVLQANLSIQLFVQRCLMNLETEVSADSEADDGWLQWAWMKYYQVWAANRKVFLYPENWIEPELRLDKSPFFQELENDLAQNEMTTKNAEDAYSSYLCKLDNVARLEVNGFYYEDETYTLHVFARTYDSPNIYYYRKWVEDRYWTAWEKIDLDISTTQVVPIVINRRLYLYWPEFREQTVPSNQTNVPGAGASSFPLDHPYKYWEIHLAVSEFRNKKWTPKKISRTFIKTGQSQNLYMDYPQENFSFIPIDLLDLAGRYLIGCYINASPKDDKDFYEAAIDFFDLGTCHGTPEVLDDYAVRYLIRMPVIPQFERSELKFLESQEVYDTSSDSLAYQQGSLFLNHIPILQQTPDIFKTPQPAQLSFLDKIILKIYWAYMQAHHLKEGRFPYPVGTFLPFFYQDKGKTFFVPQEFILQKWNRKNKQPLTGEFFYTDLLKIIQEIFRTGKLPDILKPYFADGQWPVISFRLRFSNFYHPYVCFLIKQLYMHGIDGLMKRDVQLLNAAKFPEIKHFDFAADYQPTWVVNPMDTRVVPNPADPDTLTNPGYPKETMDFNAWGSYAAYNWELFYHAPMLIAQKLSNNQQFEDAMHWYHYIFNPTDASAYTAPQRFWNTKPFFIRAGADYITQRIDQVLDMINSGNTELIKDVDDWRRNPFQPHRIAQFRTVAYQKNTVMKYLDNLVAWGDNLFRTDTRENINAATQLYILAAEILGPKPKIVPNFFEPPILNYNQLETKLDSFSNALIDLENFLPYFSDDVQGFDNGGAPLPAIDMFYFCLPKNEKLLSYWDTIADRLFKIRHSMNIDGVERSLALFDPPIDPGLLVKALASGLSISAAISGMNTPLPNYRFTLCLQKAVDISNEVRAFGASLLAALEKRDAEAMALLRSAHEMNMLAAVKNVRKLQVDEANANIAQLNKTKDVTQEKLNYYSSLQYMNTGETIAFALSTASTVIDASIAAGYALAGGLKLIPQFIAGASGFGGSPHVTVDIGGKQFGDSAEDLVKTLSAVALALEKGASLASTQGTYQRRKDEWDFQVRSAQKEITQIDQQITAAQIRLDIAQKELDNQQLQMDQAQEADKFMRSKFTNQQLYEWMITQISTVYFQSYQLAFDMAKRAERAYRYELGVADANFIQFGYWDSLKKGLLSGEKLSLDIKKMDASYYENNKREFEITRHISLNQIDPLALLKLKQTGVCYFRLPEEIFDMDYPGHYFRRVKSVAVSIPCIIGPYNNVNCTLTILKSRIRTSADAANVDYSAPPTENDPGFSFNFSSIQQMVTSNAQNDSGLFETILRDERYLPFEGHGAISEWKLELNTDFKSFDSNSISEAILHIKYTARQGGAVLAAKVRSELSNHFDQIIKTYENGTGFFKMISMKADYSTEFHQLLYPAGPAQQVNFSFTQMHVPYWLSSKNLEFDNAVPATVFLRLKTGKTVNLGSLNLQLNGQPISFAPPVSLGDLKQGSSSQSGALLGTWNLSSAGNALDPAKIDDILLVVKYKIA